MKASIVLKTYTVPPTDPPDVVRVSPEAGQVIRALQRETGLTARSIVSQIILQAAAIITIQREEAETNG